MSKDSDNIILGTQYIIFKLSFNVNIIKIHNTNNNTIAVYNNPLQIFII